MTAVKPTPWFPGGAKPVRKGVYQRMYSNNPKDIRYCFWDGDWRVGYTDVESAAEHRRGFAHYQNLPWRGIHK
jgi:hypothetical protein